jgi:hypothetical protein
MHISALDALLGFAMAYSATYVLYVWICGDARTPASRDTGAEQPARIEVRDLSYRRLERGGR